MKIIALLVPAAISLLLAGCADDYRTTEYEGGHPWRMTRTGGETDYELLDAVLFRSGSAELSEHATSVISELAAEARNQPGSSIVVDGFTDTTGTPAQNTELSRARAQNVADALSHDGVNDRRIETHGFGETHLAVPTGNNVSERRNRRVVIRIMSPA